MDILHELIAFFAIYGYIAVFLVLVACGFGLPIPEDITLVAGGVICGLAAGKLNVHTMLFVSLAGVLIGDGIMFSLGRWLGPNVKKLPLLKRVFTEQVYQQMQQKVHRYGNWILFVARFLPGLRAPIYVTAGVCHKVSFLRFFLMDGAAALISVPVWVYAGYYFAHDLDDLIEWLQQSKEFVLSGVALLLIIWVAVVLFKKYRIRMMQKINNKN